MKKKILVVVLCVALLAIAVVGGTLSYLTDTDAKTNTFTMGNVDIALTEPNYKGDANGTLHVFPGQTYAKDPTITVGKDSEDCYLVATVSISNLADLKALYANDTTGIKTDWGLSLAGAGKMVSGGIADYAAVGAYEDGKRGTLLGGKVFLTYAEQGDNIIYTFYFKDKHSANAVEVLFETVTIPSIIDNGDIKSDIKIDVNAYAIQAVGFNDVYAAYAAYVAQEN